MPRSADVDDYDLVGSKGERKGRGLSSSFCKVFLMWGEKVDELWHQLCWGKTRLSHSLSDPIGSSGWASRLDWLSPHSESFEYYQGVSLLIQLRDSYTNLSSI